MFTGIIESTGSIVSTTRVGGDLRVIVDVADMDIGEVKLGDSIAVNGVCLTAVAFDSNSFTADVSNETISLTSLQYMKPGSSVNLERALTPTSRLGGHLVSGHVDGLGELIDMSEDARSWRLRIRAPEDLKRYIATKGSITVDGISLTVNAIDDAVFELNIVPHTWERTIIQHYKPGQKVNLEVDLIARYLERLLLNMPEDAAPTISEDLLRRSGFMS